MQDTALYLTKSAIAMITLHPLNAILYSYLPTKSSSFYLCYFTSLSIDMLSFWPMEEWKELEGKRTGEEKEKEKDEQKGGS
jgi:hypothetical protein